MTYCRNCGAVLADEELLHYTDREEGRLIDDDHYACPYCKCEDYFEDMEKCEFCGYEIIPDGHGVCVNCENELFHIWGEAVQNARKLMPEYKSFSNVQDLLLDWLDRTF